MRLPTDPLLRVAMALLLFWPPLHAVLMPALDVSTWRLGGWGMYATAAPARSQVTVVGRECAFRPRLVRRPEGMRALTLGTRQYGFGALPADRATHDLALDVAAFRRDEDVRALDRRVRRLHDIDPEVPLGFVVLEPRVRAHVAFARGRIFFVTDGAISERELPVSSLGQIDAWLPSCGATQ